MAGIKEDEVKALFLGFSFSFAEHSNNGKCKMFMKNGGAETNMKLYGNKRKILI